MRVKIVTAKIPPHAPVRGANTFTNDFCRTVLNDISKVYDVTVECDRDIDFEYDIIYSLIGVPRPTDAFKAKKIIIHAHNNYVDLWRPTRIAEIQKIASIVPKLIIIYHCKGILNFLNETFPTADKVFLPHYVDTDLLPISNKKNEKCVFYGNIDDSRINAIQSLRDMISFDVVSQGSLNGIPLPNSQPFNNLDQVSGYSYGIGSGRCLLEMLGMGLKCFTLGRKYGGPILNKKDFTDHRLYNFNGMISTSCGDVLQDFENLKASNYQPELNALDIRQYTDQLTEIFKK